MTLDLDALEELEKNATRGPWLAEEFDETGGYDCMTAGIGAGPARIDGNWYGQNWCEEITPEQRANMESDIALIAAARNALPELIRLARIGQKVERDAKHPDPMSQSLNEGDGVYRP